MPSKIGVQIPVFEKSAPNHELIWETVNSLTPCDPKRIKIGNSVVERNFAHTVSWATNWSLTEAELLKDEWGTESRSFHTSLVFQKDTSMCGLFVHLKTKGLQGSTSYGLRICRVGDDDYLCWEY